jgi:glycerophosphoryl diester phosphodiesterase
VTMPTGDVGVQSPGGRPVVVAHRGDSVHAPQNTIAAFEAAWRAGAAVVELDVQLSRDGQVVVIHDDTVDATTDGTGAVAELDLAELRTLDAGSWFSAEFAGELIPVFAEVLEVAERHRELTFLVEFKGTWNETQVAKVTDPVQAVGAQDQVIVQSFSRETVAALASAAPQLRRGLLIEELSDDLRQTCNDLGVVMCNPHGQLLADHPELVALLHEAGIQVHTWTLDEPDHWRQATALGVDGIISNDPDGLRRWLD